MNIRLPSHVLHVSPAHGLDFISILIANRQVQASTFVMAASLIKNSWVGGVLLLRESVRCEKHY